MAIQTYRASFMEAYLVPARTPGGLVGTLYPNMMTGPRDTFEFQAANAKEVRAKVDELGNGLGKSVGCFVTIVGGGRKPPGFEALTRSLTYNLTEAPKHLR